MIASANWNIDASGWYVAGAISGNNGRSAAVAIAASTSVGSRSDEPMSAVPRSVARTSVRAVIGASAVSPIGARKTDAWPSGGWWIAVHGRAVSAGRQ